MKDPIYITPMTRAMVMITTLAQVKGPTGMLNNENPEDLVDGEDSNYLPESEEDVSLGPKHFIVPEDPYEQGRFQRRLIATARRMKKNQQWLLKTHKMTSG